MSSVEEIEAAVTQLPPSEFARLRAWMNDIANRSWDKEIEDDFDAGRFDAILAEVDDEIQNGRVRPLGR